MVEKTSLLLTDGDLPHHVPCSEIVSLDSFNPRRGLPSANVDDAPGPCSRCGVKIMDRFFLLAANKHWHLHCLRCCVCQVNLDTHTSCWAKDGEIYCRDDYRRRFGPKHCARCQNEISNHELVMRGREYVYHLSCFHCTSCGQPLNTGDTFGMQENNLYCLRDYEMLCQEGYLHSVSPGLGGPPPALPYYNGVGAVQKGRPRKKRSPLPDGEGCPNGMGLGPENPDRPGEVLDREYHQQPPRQKRVRTSFKHHQLRTMKSYFALNHNPDAKDLKSLAQKTGLSKRVLQVWFQNARAKFRRNQLKQQTEASDKGVGSVSPGDQGTPQGGGDVKVKDGQSLGEAGSDHRSPALSDISSSHSLSGLGTPSLDMDHSGDSMPSLFDSSGFTSP